MTIASAGKEPDCYMRVPETSVRDFIQFCSEEDSTSNLLEDNAIHKLEALDSFVAPLVSITGRGDILVLSSIGMLHRIPLHAICIDNELLICRNPIVYCQSVTPMPVVPGTTG
jgi:hypothetical protein